MCLGVVPGVCSLPVVESIHGPVTLRLCLPVVGGARCCAAGGAAAGCVELLAAGAALDVDWLTLVAAISGIALGSGTLGGGPVGRGCLGVP